MDGLEASPTNGRIPLAVIGNLPVRRRLAPSEYKLTDTQRRMIERWISSGDRQTARLWLTDQALHVEIEHTARKQIRDHNLYLSMPPETHSLEDNPLFDLLVRKSK